MENIRIELTKTPKAKPEIKGIPFGTHFTDHMFLLDYEKGRGWFDPRIVPYGPISLPPSAMVFHYAQEIFEGLKAYRTPAGGIQLFRPEENIARMAASCERLCIPEIPAELFLAALKKLVEVERDWVPAEPSASLYLRPFVIATDPHVGVHVSHGYLFAIIACPVGSYYPEGMSPVKILIEAEDVRAVRGGTGTAKCGGNYAASLRAQERAGELGYSQVLWLDGVHREYIEEVGAMNVMFKLGGKIVTPALLGTVLPGITRKSCIELLRGWGYVVEEREISVTELLLAIDSGDLEEAFGTGTAAVISPIGEIAYAGKTHEVSGFQIGELTQKLYDTLTGIQWGTAPDPYGWCVRVC
ncbi:MAG: branched-chain amino acid aminotransferase [Firmicutes bacterium]|nr:branched-chain amino acid aminotransferase [Bacillota bacterium]